VSGRGFAAVVEWVNDQNFPSPSGVKHLQNEKTDGPCGKECHTLLQAGLGKIDRVDRNAERLQHHDLERVEPYR
jgi:hypothetical protein